MAQATNPRGPLILIVDDDENVLEIATEFVQRLGYNAVVASNGADALNILRRNQYLTVLFSDIDMPGMDGEELARAAVAVPFGPVLRLRRLRLTKQAEGWVVSSIR